MKLKNDRERIAFLEDYRNEQHGWHLWKSDDDLQMKIWRLDLPHSSIIVEEWLHVYEWPQRHQKWDPRCWYVVTDWSQPLRAAAGSRSLALAMLKKELKENDKN